MAIDFADVIGNSTVDRLMKLVPPDYSHSPSVDQWSEDHALVSVFIVLYGKLPDGYVPSTYHVQLLARETVIRGYYERYPG